MIELATIVCPNCGHPHVATIDALTARPHCPFCGVTMPQAAIALARAVDEPANTDGVVEAAA